MKAEPYTAPEPNNRTAKRRRTANHSRASGLDARAAEVLRIAPGNDGVSIWSATLFSGDDNSALRRFLVRVFSIAEVSAVEILRAQGFGRVRYESSSQAPEIWRKLSDILRSSNSPSAEGGKHWPKADVLFLDWPATERVVVYREGSQLSTWRVRRRKDNEVRLTHPALRHRRDFAERLGNVLAAIAGVDEFTANVLLSSVSVRFTQPTLNVERLLQKLEKSWPQIIEGVLAPPSLTRLAVAGGLLSVAFAGQYVVPRLKPLAVLGVTLYGSHNVVKGAAQLSHREVGLPALYALGLAFTIWTGMPFASALMAVFMQTWPQLAHRSLTRGQRRLFAAHRKRPTWARVLKEGGIEIEVDIDAVAPGDLVAVRKGEFIAVDGVVTTGLAAVDEEPLSGVAGAVDKTPGDQVYALTFVRDGALTIRVEKIGLESVAGYIGKHLPHGKIDNLPSAVEAERIASRNAKAALALSVANLVGRRLLRPSQATIRPDYVTGPQLSAQLAALHDLGDGINRGIFFRDPSALDRLPATDIYVFDGAATIGQQPIQVADVISAGAVSAEAILGYAAAAFPVSQNERADALAAQSALQGISIPGISQRTRRAGAVCFRDFDGREVEVATFAYLENAGIIIRPDFAKIIAASGADGGARHDVEFLLRPLWIARDGKLLGAVTFRRDGEPHAAEVIAVLKARNKRADFVYLASTSQSTAEALARKVGISSVFGDLDGRGKADVLTKLGPRTMWIGHGDAPEAKPSIETSAVSISVAGAPTVASDAADIVFLQPGLHNLVPLRIIGRAHHARIANDYKVVYAANLTGVAGGFFAGFGSLQAGLISNLGTGFVYVRRLTQLKHLISQVEARRASVRSLDKEEGVPVSPPDPELTEEFVETPSVDGAIEPGSDLNAV